jgi:perosamine synthetase
MSHEIPLSRPDITDAEVNLVTSVLRSGRLAMGPYTDQFEHLLASRADCLHGVAVSSGTTGLHLAMLALGIGPGDEVITTPFSFVASANCMLYVGARPVFVDIDPKTLNMDPALVEKAITPRTRAILAVETFGNPAHMEAYRSIAARHEIPLIEDCCEALGSSLGGRPCGAFGRLGVFAFYPNKQITTGEGGMIVTSDTRLANLCRSMRNQGRAVEETQTPGSPTNTGAWLRHERLGYNYRLDEMSAALGVAQVRRLDEIIEKRQHVAASYMRRLMEAGQASNIMLPTIVPGSVMSWFVFVVRLDAGYSRAERDRIIQGMRRHDVGASDYFPCIHLQPAYRKLGFEPGMFPIAESVSQRTIALPFYNDLSDGDIDIVVRTLDLMIARENLSRG